MIVIVNHGRDNRHIWRLRVNVQRKAVRRLAAIASGIGRHGGKDVRVALQRRVRGEAPVAALIYRGGTDFYAVIQNADRGAQLLPFR